MEFVKLTHENLEQEHICCAISSNRDPQVASKKAWLKERLDEGIVFLKSNENRMLYGVCGGIAEYFGIDPTLVRLGWVLFCALGGSGIIAYIMAAIIIPKNMQ